jgi:hypothetical protein
MMTSPALISFLLLACRQDAKPYEDGCGYPGDADHDLYTAASGGGGDCADSDPLINPGVEDISGDGIDADCDGIDGEPEACVATTEVCDGLDNDCDGAVDDPLLLALAQGATTAILSDLGDGPVLVLGTTPADGSEGYLDIFKLDGSLVVHVEGTDQGPTFGQQLAGGRDYTGDGIPDLAVAAPYATTEAGPNSGRVFVLAGPITSGTTLQDAIFVFEGGELDGNPGTSLAFAPDLTGDGKAELLLSNYRHVMLFAAATGTVGVEQAYARWELSTGGGAWHFATQPDVDGDGLDELVFGMDTYNSGAGVLWGTNSQRLQTGDGTYGPLDQDFWQEGEAGAGVGNKLVRVENALWYLSAGVPTRADTQETLPYTAINLLNLGDLTGDGKQELGLETETGLVLPELEASLAGYAGFQSARDLGPAQDVSMDGVPDLAWRTYNLSGVLDLKLGLSQSCNQDGDLVSAAAGDCDDADPAVSLLAGREICDGLDNDCNGVVDDWPERTVAGDFLWGSSMGDGGAVLLSNEGSISVLSAELETVISFEQSLSPGPAQVAGVGDVDGDGQSGFLVASSEAHLLYRSDLSTQTLFLDGTRFIRSAQAGSAGDIDGDGLNDPWILAKDSSGRLALVFWHLPPETTVLDDADATMILPEGWLSVTVGAAWVGQEGGADLNGDGRDDLVIGNKDAWLDGGGRASMVPVINDGEYEMDTYSVLNIYGDPDEALGATIALGDIDSDGLADAVLGGTRGARLISGMNCPLPDAYPVPTDGLLVVDLDGDGELEIVGSELNADVLGLVDAGAIWAGSYGEAPELWRIGEPRGLLGIQLFGMPGGFGAVAEEEVRFFGECGG